MWETDVASAEKSMAECAFGCAVLSRIYIFISSLTPDHCFAGEYFILLHDDLAGGGGALLSTQ